MKNKQELEKILIAILDDMLDLNEYPLDADLKEDLGMDSLDHVEFIMYAERELNVNIPDEVSIHIHTIEQAVNYLLTLPDNEG